MRQADDPAGNAGGLRFADMRDPEAWQAQAPGLRISNGAALPAPPCPQALLDNSAALFAREGYVQLPPAIDGSLLAAMRSLIDALQQRQLPPVLAFVFDEFWQVFFQQHTLITRLLDGEYSLLPDFWAWHIDPASAQAGWAPHRDKGRRSLRADGQAQSLTIWIALSDATPLNGCMYIVPADRDPAYGREDEDVWQFQVQDIRALPAAAGSILAWNQAVLHWGGRSAPREAAPRISIALEFQRSDIAPYNTPLLPPDRLPDFATRLQLIGRQILRYQHMYALSEQDRELGAWLAATAVAR